MSKSDSVPMMYEVFPAVAALNQVQGFNPLKMLRRMVSPKTGEEVLRLDLQYKKLWFRLRHPEGRIRVNPLRITEQIAIYEAQVYLHKEDPAPVCSFTSSISKEEAPDGKYIQAAQEDAIDNALSDAGFGIQLSDVSTPASMRHYGSEIPVSQLNGNASVPTGQVKPTQSVSKPVVQAPSAPEQSATAIQQSPATKAAERPVQVTQNVAPAQPTPAPQAVQPTATVQTAPVKNVVQTTAPSQPATATNVVQPSAPAPAVKAPAVQQAPVQTVTQQTVNTASVAQPNAVAQPQPAAPVQEQPKPAQEAHTANAALEILRGGNPAPAAAPVAQPAVAPVVAAEADDKDLPFTFGPAYNNSMSPEEIAAVMTLEQAKAVVVDSGVCKGMTMGEVAEKRPFSLKFYLFGGYRGDNNILKAAAKVVYEQLQNAA